MPRRLFGIALSLVALASQDAPAVAAPEWQPPVEVATGWITTPIVAASAGGAAVGWREARYGNCNDYDRHGCRQVRVAIRRADGSFFPPVTLNAPHAGHANMLRLAVTADGDVLAAWHQPDIVYYPDEASSAYYEAVGSVRTGRFGAPRRVAPYSWSGLDPLTLVTNGRGDAALAWPDSTSNGSGRVRVMLRPSDGEWSRPVTVATTEMMHPPGLALADDGRLLVLWADRTERRGDVAVRALVRAPGGDLTEPVVLQTVRMTVNSAWANDLTPAWTREGERVAFWRSGPASCPSDCESPVTAYAAWASGRRFSAPQRLSLAPSSLQLVVDRGGRATAAWVEYRDSSSADAPQRTEIRLAQRPPGGEFSKPRTVVPGGEVPQLAPLGRDVFLTWHAKSESGGNEWLGAFRPDDRLRAMTNTIVGPSSGLYTDIAATPAHELAAVWQEYDGSETHLLFRSGPDGSTPPAVSGLAVSRPTASRGRNGWVFRFRLSEPAKVELRLRRARSGRSSAVRSAWREAGHRKMRISATQVQRLRPGRYLALVRITDRVGDRGRSGAIRVRVVP